MSWGRDSRYREWKEACKERDNYTCQFTGATTRLEVHHLNSGSYFPDERYDIDNGITIHRAVHLFFHWFYMKSTRTKCTKKDWKRFYRYRRYLFIIQKVFR